MIETDEEALERRTEYIEGHALEGEFHDIVGCMAYEQRHTVKELGAENSRLRARLVEVEAGARLLLEVVREEVGPEALDRLLGRLG